jgi:hypothetical protein
MKSMLQERSGIEGIAKMAMQWGARHLKDYGSARSRHDFTQRQLMACLILRACLRTTYRGLLDLLSASPGLRHELGLGGKLPHYTTLQKFNDRNRILEIAEAMIQNVDQANLPQALPAGRRQMERPPTGHRGQDACPLPPRSERYAAQPLEGPGDVRRGEPVALGDKS